VAVVDVETADSPTAVIETGEDEGGSPAPVQELAMSKRTTAANCLAAFALDLKQGFGGHLGCSDHWDVLAPGH
jgi:hypothetical protein